MSLEEPQIEVGNTVVFYVALTRQTFEGKVIAIAERSGRKYYKIVTPDLIAFVDKSRIVEVRQ